MHGACSLLAELNVVGVVNFPGVIFAVHFLCLQPRKRWHVPTTDQITTRHFLQHVVLLGTQLRESLFSKNHLFGTGFGRDRHAYVRVLVMDRGG